MTVTSERRRSRNAWHAAGGRERGAPPAAEPSPVTRFFGEQPMGLFADRTRGATAQIATARVSADRARAADSDDYNRVVQPGRHRHGIVFAPSVE